MQVLYSITGRVQINKQPMHAFTPFHIGSLTLPNRLIQGPLAGFSCAPFRESFNPFLAPAYCVSEMVSAHDVITKHQPQSRYLYRSPQEKYLCYQISGHHPETMANAAAQLEQLGANLIDLNCGCPKPKIRKKGAGSALLENPKQLSEIIKAVRKVIQIPLTVKIRLQNPTADQTLARMIEDAGADALIVHGRRWIDDYSIPVNSNAIANIKQHIHIPVIANGDIKDALSLEHMSTTGCDAFMISRAGCGQPDFYQRLLLPDKIPLTLAMRIDIFLLHLQKLASLENEHRAVLQSKTLFRYYFREWRDTTWQSKFYRFESLQMIKGFFYPIPGDTLHLINT